MLRATFPATTRSSSLLSGSVLRVHDPWREIGGMSVQIFVLSRRVGVIARLRILNFRVPHPKYPMGKAR